MKIYEHEHGQGLLGLRGPGGHVVSLANGIVLSRHDEPLPGFEKVPLLLRVELVRALRSLLDRWIDSGRDFAGNDEPSKRNVYWQPAEHLEPLADVLRRWNRRHAADVLILRSGERSLTMGKPKNNESHDPDPFLPSQYEPLPETEREAREIAIYWLQELLDSPDGYRVAGCDNPKCRRPYYLRERVRTDVIKNGTYCKNCLDAGSARRVKASLERRKRKIIECAADVWDAFKPSDQYSRKSDWVAVQVNTRLDLNKPIRGKWITQNQQAIETALANRRSPTKRRKSR